MEDTIMEIGAFIKFYLSNFLLIINDFATLIGTVMSLPSSKAIQHNATLVLTPSTSYTFAGLVVVLGRLTIVGRETLPLAGAKDEEGSNVQDTYEGSKLQWVESSLRRSSLFIFKS
jgi:hypothetical protein